MGLIRFAWFADTASTTFHRFECHPGRLASRRPRSAEGVLPAHELAQRGPERRALAQTSALDRCDFAPAISRTLRRAHFTSVTSESVGTKRDAIAAGNHLDERRQARQSVARVIA
jgi:hypothetical protein